MSAYWRGECREMMMPNDKHYVVEAERSGKWWSLSVRGVAFAHSQARRLDQVPRVAKDLLSDLLDTPGDEITITVEPILPQKVVLDIGEARRRAAEGERLRDEAATLLREAARRLTIEQHMTVRDVGAVLGVSYQRAQQLLADNRRMALPIVAGTETRGDPAPRLEAQSRWASSKALSWR